MCPFTTICQRVERLQDALIIYDSTARDLHAEREKDCKMMRTTKDGAQRIDSASIIQVS